MSTERDNNVYMAKLAEQAERYDEMVQFTKEVAKVRKSADKRQTVVTHLYP
ncbi:Putative 14-3-3 family protein epsilon [Rhizopus microsporus]|nr:Putative 14-3-3 family protein epsilon [Rhizopus microsporus]